MPEYASDAPELTDEQLRAVVSLVGKDARAKAFAAGLPIHFIKGGSIIALYPDGTEEIVKVLNQPTENGVGKE